MKYKIRLTKQNKETLVEGTFPELLDRFHSILFDAAEWDTSINSLPTTVTELVDNLKRSYTEIEPDYFNRTTVELLTKIEEGSEGVFKMLVMKNRQYSGLSEEKIQYLENRKRTISNYEAKINGKDHF